MKNIKKIFVLVISLLLIPVVVKADMGAPESSPIDAIVSNKDGAEFYKYDYKSNKYVKTGDTLDYGEVVKVVYSYGKYASLEKYDDSVLLKDLELNLDASAIKFDNHQKFYAYEKTTIYDVPSFYGKKVATVDKGKEITVKQATDGSYFDAWRYTKYDGKKGWVYVVDGNLEETSADASDNEYAGIKSTLANVNGKSKKVMITSKTIVASKPGEDDLDTAMVEGKEYEYDYYYNEPFNVYYHLTDENVWVKDVAVSLGVNRKIIFTDVEEYPNLYINLGNRSKTHKNDFESDKLYSIGYYYNNIDEDGEWYQLVDGKNKYWIELETYCEGTCNEGVDVAYAYEIELKKDANYYKDSLLTEKIGKIEASEKYIAYELFNDKDETIYFVDGYGYISVADVEDSKYLEEDEIDEEEKEELIIEDDEEESEEEEKEKTPKDYMMYYVGGGVVLALTAIVTIKLISKNKKDKNANNTQNEKSNE